jgi:8-oxo-dGTP diphosphatase
VTGKPSIRVVAGVVFREGRFLAALRPEGAPYGGLWEFPGGKVEPGERDEEALRREIREELGADASIGERIDSCVHAYPEKTVELHFYKILSLSREAVAIGVAAIRWVDPAAAEPDRFLAGDREFLGKLADPLFRSRWFS